jgi:hypothetical protein
MTSKEDSERAPRDLTDLTSSRRRGVVERVTKDKPQLQKKRVAPSIPLVTSRKPAPPQAR